VDELAASLMTYFPRVPSTTPLSNANHEIINWNDSKVQVDNELNVDSKLSLIDNLEPFPRFQLGRVCTLTQVYHQKDRHPIPTLTSSSIAL